MLLGTILGSVATNPRHIVFFVIDDYGFADASYKALS